jgi:hypothetical protein
VTVKAMMPAIACRVVDHLADLERRLASSADGERGKPNHRLAFPDVPAALAELAGHDVTAAGFHHHTTLVAQYAQAVRARPAPKPV